MFDVIKISCKGRVEKIRKRGLFVVLFVVVEMCQ